MLSFLSSTSSDLSLWCTVFVTPGSILHGTPDRIFSWVINNVARPTQFKLTQISPHSHTCPSRYSYRTLYASVPGSGSVMATPFVYQSQFIEPSFSRQRIMPQGYDRFDLIPGYGSAIFTPFGFSNSYNPGFGRGLVAPFGAPAFE